MIFLYIAHLVIPIGAIGGMALGAIGVNPVEKWGKSEKTSDLSDGYSTNQTRSRVWRNLLWLIFPIAVTIAAHLTTGLSFIKFFLIPATMAGFIIWLAGPSRPTKQMWCCIFIGCLASWSFINHVLEP
jgi:hypothetical protein